jgi:hypothetical protein
MSIVEKEHETITWIEVGQDWEWYYFVPLLDRQEWDGIQYDNIQYGWDELDYRFGVDYPEVPEPATTGLLMGLAFLAVILYRHIIK